MKQKVRLWDIARKRIKKDVRQLSFEEFKQELIKEFGEKSGITKYFSNKSLFEWLKETLIEKRTRNKTYLSFKPRRWTHKETSLLKKLCKKFKGKRLVEEFNKIVLEPRTYSSIITKLSRLHPKKPKTKQPKTKNLPNST